MIYVLIVVSSMTSGLTITPNLKGEATCQAIGKAALEMIAQAGAHGAFRCIPAKEGS